MISDQGKGLNKPAVITLEKCYPKTKTKNNPQVLKKYQEKLLRATKEMGATFVSYDPETGNWVFSVEHFSRYGLADSEDDEDESEDDEDDEQVDMEEEEEARSGGVNAETLKQKEENEPDEPRHSMVDEDQGSPPFNGAVEIDDDILEADRISNEIHTSSLSGDMGTEPECITEPEESYSPMKFDSMQDEFLGFSDSRHSGFAEVPLLTTLYI